MIITLCGSIKFAKKLKRIADELKGLGHTVYYPEPAESLDTKSSVQEIIKTRTKLIRRHLDYIDKSDAVLLVNLTRNGVENYLGVSALSEATYAFGRKKQLFALNELPKELNYSIELAALNPIVINGDLAKIQLNE